MGLSLVRKGSFRWNSISHRTVKSRSAIPVRSWPHNSLFDVRVSPSGEVAFLEACLYCSFAPRSVLARMAGATGEASLGLAQLFTELVERAARRKVNVAVGGGGSRDGDGGGSVQARGMKVRMEQ